MYQVRHVPALHAALAELLREGAFLAGPYENGRPTHWLPCSCCDAVVTAGAAFVSVTCPDCTAPCADPECGLLVHEHRGGCEPRQG